MGVLRFINGLLDRLFVVAGAFLGSQIPQFMQQYVQRLAGHVEELNYLLGQLRQMASLSNKSLEQYIDKFITSSDPDFAAQGQLMQQIIVRWENLSQSLTSITSSSIWTRPYALTTHLDSTIAHSTLHSFQPGVSLTLEGLYYTGIGLLLGFIFYQGLIKLIRLVFYSLQTLTQRKKVR